ncbi:MAG: glycosyltransferase [Marinicella sp.]
MTTINQYIKQLSQKTWLFAARKTAVTAKTSVVIPVYNGFEALELCIASLILYTCPSISIIFLDDASTDPRVAALLDQTQKKHKQVKVITRLQNLGYLHNVNSFVAESDDDLVLLNADTRVTAGWLKEMQRIAADPRVGAVCPLSDHATILTIKNTKPNQLKVLKRYSGHWYPIPTAVGFCMLIKRSVIQKIGGFDPYYDPGYGEECDYSMLIRQKGLQVACAPAAFVYHQGSQSFGAKGQRLQQLHQKLLDLRWPGYTKEVTLFASKNPTKLIDIQLDNSQEKKRKVLHVLHGIDNKGGVELFTRELLNRFDDRFHHTVLIPERNKKFKTKAEKLNYQVIEIDTLAHRADHIIFNLPADLYHHQYDLFFQNILLAGEYAWVHFHSLIGVGTTVWPLICHQLGISYQLFIHDHFGLCQIFSLTTRINNKMVYCGEPAMQSDKEKCQKCMVQNTQKTKLTTASYMSLRQHIWQQIITEATHIYFPSHYLQLSYLNQFPQIVDKSTVFKPCFYQESEAVCTTYEGNKINIAFVGQFCELKGAELFLEFYEAIGNKEISWHVFGGIDPRYQKQLMKTEIKCYGQYESNMLKDLLVDIDLVVLTSVFPETYGITLTEAWINGKPVLAPKIGVYESRITEGVNGFLYQFNDLTSLKLTFEQWLKRQKSGQGIKSIYYREHVENNPNLILENHQKFDTYNQPLTNSLQVQQAVLLNKPEPAAWDLMQLWLDAPATLEAAADWQSSPANVSVIILGDELNKLNNSITRIQKLLPEPLIFRCKVDLTPSAIKRLSNPCLIITAGTLINENIGNWLHDFKQQKQIISTANYALHNHLAHQYGAQFQQRFSRQNHLISAHLTAAVLVDPCIFSDYQLQDVLSHNNINTIVDKWGKSNQHGIHHFPYLCYSMDDADWAKNWKSQLLNHTTKTSKQTNKVLLLLESHLDHPELKMQLQAQTVFTTVEATLISYLPLQKAHVIKDLDIDAYDYMVLLNDNLRFSETTHLEKVIHQLEKSCLDAISPVTNNSINEGKLAGKKWGAANHFVGIGQIRDTRFDLPDSAFEYDLLDDDVTVLKQGAFKAIRENWANYTGHYGAIYLTQWLHQAGLRTGLLFVNGLHKRSLPSQIYDSKDNSLQQQRQKIIAQHLHFPANPVYSDAFSCRNSCNLDIQLTAFKTPKNLPRIVAFAHDDWASGFYRVKTPLLALAAENHASVHFLPQSRKQYTATPYELEKLQPDTILLHHFFSDTQLSALLQYKKQTSARILLGIDDLLTDIPDYSPFYELTPEDSKTRIKLACSLVDGVVVSTEQLAAELGEYHQNIQVIPNRLSKTIWQNLTICKTPQDKLRIGWAGAGQHQMDLAFLKPIVQATSSYCDWVFFGDEPAQLDNSLYHFETAVLLPEYPKKLAKLNLDVAVAPLVDNRFNRAKSNLKLLEFGILGVPVIASDLTPYQNSPAILRPNDAQSWIQMIHQLHQDRSILEHHGHAIQQWVQRHYLLEDHLIEWIELLL